MTSPYGSPVTPALPPGAVGFARPNHFALWRMVVSISLYVIPLLINAPIGLVLSIIGLRRARQIRAAGLVPTGRGMAIAGIIIGAFGTLSIVIIVLLWIFVVPTVARETGLFSG